MSAAESPEPRPGRVRADRAELIAGYGFDLDGFQLQALDALDDGRSVLVAAPTGSGKTVVAEYAVAGALADGRRAFYTAPIKALSNQKYHDLCQRHGAHQVGLLTGDNAINGDAPVVVMTTEVLRNMIYAGSRALDRLAVVVLDEVHFLQDTYRGPVWEEVIIHLDPAVRLVCLSATVSNAAELAEWMTTVRGPTEAVVELRRPVRLEQLYLVGDRTSERLHLLPTLVDDRPNPEASRLDGDRLRSARPSRTGPPRRRRPLYTPSRLDVVERLHVEDMLPAIYFIFSRNQCDEAARTCLERGVRLTTNEERRRIRELADARLAGLGARDLAVLGGPAFLAALEAGIAPHHAGMVPPFKEAVEACFVEGLVKVVFATETLAVGVNMPARTVVIEKLTKFTGEQHTALTPGEYTQLTGRAGRRGIDPIGHAVVLWNPFVPFDQVAELAQSREFHLNSAFRPTYNMAANLVRSFSHDEAHRLLNLSFAQFQSDRNVVKVERRLERRRGQLAELRSAATSPYGDLADYRAALAAATPVRSKAGDAAIGHALARLRPGDVLYVEQGRYAGRVAVLSVANRKGGVKLQTITPNRHTITLSEPDFDEPPRVLAHFDLPTPFAPNRQGFQREVARALERARLEPRGQRFRPGPDSERDHGRGRIADHPVAADPDLRERLAAAAHADRIAAEVDGLANGVARRSGTLSRALDHILAVLERRGYSAGWSLTEAGEELARTFHECDLLVVECVRAGVLDGLDAATTAGLVSVFVYEHRSPEPPAAPWFPSAAVRRRWERIVAISEELQADERAAGLPVHRSPDPTFFAIAHAWAVGEGFAEVVESEDLSGGDFVRTTKQLIDLLVQLAATAPVPETRHAAGAAADRLFRGVVAASSRVIPEDDP